MSQARPELLFLAHRIPYPPNKGDKLRSYHLLLELREQFDVHLGCFIDERSDWQHTEHVAALCASTYFARIGAVSARVRGVFCALLNNDPVTLRYFWNRGLARWAKVRSQAPGVGAVLAFSSPMAQYVPADFEAAKVIDFVDVDSEKWRQYAATSKGPTRWLYKREAKLLLRFERETAQRFDWSLFVTRQEAAMFLDRVPETKDRVRPINNGVDYTYFSPDEDRPNPFVGLEKTIVFTGAMDYAPNVDAVSWFVQSVLPKLRATVSNLVFYIVGLNPTERVRRLSEEPGVYVTGRVPDIRPYLQHASVAVAPLRVARGVQNKVLEALAMGTPVVATSAAAEGLHCEVGREVFVANGPEEFSLSVLTALVNDPQTRARAREKVVSHYDWAVNLAPVGGLLTG